MSSPLIGRRWRFESTSGVVSAGTVTHDIGEGLVVVRLDRGYYAVETDGRPAMFVSHIVANRDDLLELELLR